ncbi:MAG: MauE/DoxX family redox-associated membrane protein [Actinomycetota bacterium]
MVETNTPVVHGGRTRRWALALALHVVGAGIAAAAFGAVLGAAGMALGAPWGAAGFVAIGALGVLYLTREALGVRVPVPQLRRQVPDWWRTFFGFGTAALLYGMGVGIGFLTFLRQGTFVVVTAAAISTGRPLLGAVLVAPFGVARGLSAVVASTSRTQEDGTALVGRLSSSGSWVGWRVAHAGALLAVIGAAAFAIQQGSELGDLGGVAAVALAIAFGWAGVSKVVRARRWRRSLQSYGFGGGFERTVAVGVPLLELGIGVIPFLGLPSTAGVVSLGVLGVFSVGIVAARIRNGPRLDCGCFGAARVRDYRLLLARNGALAIVALVAWRRGTDTWIGADVVAPSGSELVPAALVALGLVLATLVVVATVRTVRRGVA